MNYHKFSSLHWFDISRSIYALLALVFFGSFLTRWLEDALLPVFFSDYLLINLYLYYFVTYFVIENTPHTGLY